ncbi:hypothetical protein V5O48_004595 [Marasmius crinis-equi]|uniref:Uncharacterized protein n=1 Tax=Marasmius crinis-equi TaxID=585013 RepID=A0ABR3FQD5_9AGAR
MSFKKVLDAFLTVPAKTNQAHSDWISQILRTSTPLKLTMPFHKGVPPLEIDPQAHARDLETIPPTTQQTILQPPKHPPADIILSISPLDVQSILDQKTTTYEFVFRQSINLLLFVERIWFYVTVPEFSLVLYICEVGAMKTTDEETEGKVKKKISDCTVSFLITSLYQLHQPLALSTLEQQYGLKTAPREGTILPVPMSMLEAVPWHAQQLVWTLQTQVLIPPAGASGKKAQMKRKASEVAGADGGENIEVTRVAKRLRRSSRLASRNRSMAAVSMMNPPCDAMDTD